MLDKQRRPGQVVARVQKDVEGHGDHSHDEHDSRLVERLLYPRQLGTALLWSLQVVHKIRQIAKPRSSSAVVAARTSENLSSTKFVNKGKKVIAEVPPSQLGIIRPNIFPSKANSSSLSARV